MTHYIVTNSSGAIPILDYNIIFKFLEDAIQILIYQEGNDSPYQITFDKNFQSPTSIPTQYINAIPVPSGITSKSVIQVSLPNIFTYIRRENEIDVFNFYIPFSNGITTDLYLFSRIIPLLQDTSMIQPKKYNDTLLLQSVPIVYAPYKDGILFPEFSLQFSNNTITIRFTAQVLNVVSLFTNGEAVTSTYAIGVGIAQVDDIGLVFDMIYEPNDGFIYTYNMVINSGINSINLTYFRETSPQSSQ